MKKDKSIYFRALGNTYGDSSRSISEYIHHSHPEIKLFWEVSQENIKYVPQYAHCVTFKSLASYKAMATSKIWVLSSEIAKESGIWKSPTTYIVNTWHGDRGMKAVGRIAADRMGSNYAKSKITFDNYSDLFLAGSDYGEKKALEAFNYKGEISKVGIPRNDKLVNLKDYGSEIKVIKEKLNIPEDTKILLYAPTFRDKDRHHQSVDVDLSECLSILGKKEKWICLIRAHAAAKHLNCNNVGLNIMDVSNYPDMTDLLMVSDCLFTDYSSCAGDFILTDKPVVLCHFDKESYTSNRALYVNPDEIGYLIAHNQLELDDILAKLYTFDHHAIHEKVDSFYGTKESGQATEIISKKILQHILK